MNEEKQLLNELQQRGTAEISNGKIVQVTQALNESKKQVTFMLFGKLQTKNIRSIDEACASCNHCHSKTIKEC
jgi:hypothetical protein